MTKCRLNYRFMETNGEMIERPFIGWHGDTSDRTKFTVKWAGYGYAGALPTFTDQEAAEQERMLDVMCGRENLAADRSGAAYARQFVRVPA